MEFNIVIGNPPYNNDLYLDFVQTGYQMLKDDGVMVMITPAKWAAKGGKKNELFREQIVPHMKEIVFYPCAQEIFDIRNLDGISVYSVDKDTHSTKRIKNVSSRVSAFNNEAEREIDGQLNNVAIRIIKKLGTFTSINLSTSANYFGFGSCEKPCGYGDLEVWSNNTCIGKHDTSNVKKNAQDIKLYKLMMNKMAGNCEYGLSGNVLGMNRMMKLGPNQIAPCAYMMLYKSSINDLEFAESYFNTKLIRFLAQTGLTGQSFAEPGCMRFVPDPGSFDHIFTDAELYQKYGLTQDEINIIESVIKERK